MWVRRPNARDAAAAVAGGPRQSRPLESLHPQGRPGADQRQPQNSTAPGLAVRPVLVFASRCSNRPLGYRAMTSKCGPRAAGTEAPMRSAANPPNCRRYPGYRPWPKYYRPRCWGGSQIRALSSGGRRSVQGPVNCLPLAEPLKLSSPRCLDQLRHAAPVAAAPRGQLG